jgi:hypothetical protein
MPITLFLAGQAFELEVIEAMSAAFVAACDALHLKISDPAARFVAENVARPHEALPPNAMSMAADDTCFFIMVS